MRDIAQALEARLHAAAAPSLDTLPGATLFFTHLSRATGDPAYARAARDAAERSARAIAEVPLGPSLFGGLAGMAWPLAHMQRLGARGAEELDLGQVDELLLECVGYGAIPHFDLIVGIVGLGVYFLERLPDAVAAEGVRRVILELAGRARRDGHGLAWFTGPGIVAGTQRETFPEGKYDLGMAHGVPGVIAFLSLALLAGAGRDPAEAMLRDAVRWLVSHQRADAGQGAYGTAIDARDPARPLHRRAAWCYGDPGIAVALLLAARALGDGALRAHAHALARSAASFAAWERGRVLDASLCHGSAGLAHLFGLLGDTLGDGGLRARAAGWHAVTLAMRTPGEGIAGFCYSQGDDAGGARRRVADPSLLQGAAGIGLSLLWGIGGNGDRSWDRMLLLG